MTEEIKKNRERDVNDTAKLVLHAFLTRSRPPLENLADTDLAELAFDLAETMQIERESRAADVAKNAARASTLAELGQICVDYADNTDDCPLCSGNAAGGSHDDGCKVAEFLAEFGPAADEPIPYRPATRPPPPWTGPDELEPASAPAVTENAPAGLVAPATGMSDNDR